MEEYKTVEENYQRYRDARYSSHFIEESFIGFIDKNFYSRKFKSFI